MHVLVINDDGPPSATASPYIHSFVQALQAREHRVSVCLPNTQRSWIGKAHIVGAPVTTSYYRPGRDPHQATGSVHNEGIVREGDTEEEVEEWVLLDSTPATCAQLGIHHLFVGGDEPAIDLVVSGPNYGRNTTAVFGLSSGTLGGALEAAICGKRAVALSYAFDRGVMAGWSQGEGEAVVVETSTRSVEVIEWLQANWAEEADLYSVNVPLLKGIGTGKVLWTKMLGNTWGAGRSCFREVDASGESTVPGVKSTEAEEKVIREEDRGADEQRGQGQKGPAKRHFKWAPSFHDVHQSVEKAGAGNDGWVVKEGHISVTPLRANFMHADGFEGEINLGERKLHGPDMYNGTISLTLEILPQSPGRTNSSDSSALDSRPAKTAVTSPATTLSVRDKATLLPGGAATMITRNQPELSPSLDSHTDPHLALADPTRNMLHILLDYQDDLVEPLIRRALVKQLATTAHKFITDIRDLPCENTLFVGITTYERTHGESIPMTHFLLTHPGTALANTYLIRKALIRKHYLSLLLSNHLLKHPDSALGLNVRESWGFEVDYAEFLDEALEECYELRASLDANQQKPNGREREWWVLKPGMSDGGNGIRLFSTMDELRDIFKTWEQEKERDEIEEDEMIEDGDSDRGDGIMTSQLRHFVAQKYVERPLLIRGVHLGGERKFHIRTYVMAQGGLKVWVYREMLALFASAAYAPPWEKDGAQKEVYLTNTAQAGASAKEAVRAFWDLPDAGCGHGQEWKEAVFSQICRATGEVFEAAAREMSVHFQTVPNSFEVFGLDFLVDYSGVVFLLEVNAFPDFAKTGGFENRGLGDRLVGGLWEGIVAVGVKSFFKINDKNNEDGKCPPWAICADVEPTCGMTKVLDIDLGRR